MLVMFGRSSWMKEAQIVVNFPLPLFKYLTKIKKRFISLIKYIVDIFSGLTDIIM